MGSVDNQNGKGKERRTWSTIMNLSALKSNSEHGNSRSVSRKIEMLAEESKKIAIPEVEKKPQQTHHKPQHNHIHQTPESKI